MFAPSPIMKNVMLLLRLGGFAAFVIYMVTTFALYVPDWSFVLHGKHKTETYHVIYVANFAIKYTHFLFSMRY